MKRFVWRAKSEKAHWRALRQYNVLFVEESKLILLCSTYFMLCLYYRNHFSGSRCSLDYKRSRYLNWSVIYGIYIYIQCNQTAMKKFYLILSMIQMCCKISKDQKLILWHQISLISSQIEYVDPRNGYILSLSKLN